MDTSAQPLPSLRQISPGKQRVLLKTVRRRGREDNSAKQKIKPTIPNHLRRPYGNAFTMVIHYTWQLTETIHPPDL